MQNSHAKEFRVCLYLRADSTLGGDEFPRCLIFEKAECLHSIDFKIWAIDADEAIKQAKDSIGSLNDPHHNSDQCRNSFEGKACGGHFVCQLVSTC